MGGTASLEGTVDPQARLGDILTIPSDQILSTEVEMTIIGGEIVFER